MTKFKKSLQRNQLYPYLKEKFCLVFSCDILLKRNSVSSGDPVSVLNASVKNKPLLCTLQHFAFTFLSLWIFLSVNLLSIYHLSTVMYLSISISTSLKESLRPSHIFSLLTLLSQASIEYILLLSHVSFLWWYEPRRLQQDVLILVVIGNWCTSQNHQA